MKGAYTIASGIRSQVRAWMSPVLIPPADRSEILRFLADCLICNDRKEWTSGSSAHHTLKSRSPMDGSPHAKSE